MHAVPSGAKGWAGGKCAGGVNASHLQSPMTSENRARVVYEKLEGILPGKVVLDHATMRFVPAHAPGPEEARLHLLQATLWGLDRSPCMQTDVKFGATVRVPAMTTFVCDWCGKKDLQVCLFSQDRVASGAEDTETAWFLNRLDMCFKCVEKYQDMLLKPCRCSPVTEPMPDPDTSYVLAALRHNKYEANERGMVFDCLCCGFDGVAFGYLQSPWGVECGVCVACVAKNVLVQ